ncbi:MAG TPA: 50S ribosomal protein L4 [Candidatus Acidoferrales bacterium]|nr:50S ribosomal protein L4 [Candidatus Acidoferrales bacterium]
MPVVDVKNLDGKKVGTVELADDVFSAKMNPHLLHEAVRHHLAGERAGTHKTKDKSEVSGAGRKLWRQKGTGRARIGSIRSPLWRHGGTVHGPTPRDYSYALPKKMILGALRSALSTKLADDKMTVVDGWKLDSHKTKPFRQALTKLDSEMKTILLVENGANVNLERASRNLEGVTLVAPTTLKPYDLMRHDRLMLSRDAAVRLSHALSLARTAEAPASSESAAAAKPAEAKAAPTRAPKAASKPAAKKPAAAKKEKPKAKPKAKKD